MVKFAAGVMALGVLGLAALSTEAQAVSSQPKILLHVKAVTTKTPCVSVGVTTCDQATVTGMTGMNYHVQVLVAEGDSLNTADNGIAGVQFGLAYDGAFDPVGNPSLEIDIFGWTLCATLEFASPSPPWPNPQGGNLITWDAVNACQRANIATAGYFYMAAYSAGELRIIPRPIDGIAKVADCGSMEVRLNEVELGFASFSANGTLPGCNPCLPPGPSNLCMAVAVAPTTWSRIKTLR